MTTASMRRRITLQQRSTSQDAIGGQINTWSNVATVWADIMPLSGREKLAGEAVRASVTHQIVIRYQAQFADPKVMAAMRATETKDGVTRIFNFLDARDEEERRRTLILDAEEGLNNG